MHASLCSCGSGRVFGRCHGDPANEFARAQALAEARHIALLFPSARLRSAAADALAERFARELGDAEEVGEGVLDAAKVGEDDARRLVDDWSAAYPDRWASLCHTAADVAAVERELVKGALAAAIHERLPTPPELVTELELVELSPCPALAFLLPPQLVWSYDEARAAAAARPELIDEIAAALGRFEHVARVRSLAALLRRELPFRGRPRASRVLAEACATVERDLEFARAVCTLLAHAYAHELNEQAALHHPSKVT